MSISTPFILRPVATTLLTIGLALAGTLAFFLLPVSPMPNVDFPVIVVAASLPGASPETVATSVTTPLERHLGTIAGVTEMTSSSAVGNARIVLQFELNRDIDGAARDVEAAIQGARVDLPTSLRSNPTYRKINPADAPVLILALTSDTLTGGQIYDSASTIMQQKLLQVDGIGDVTIGGGSLPAVRVELNPRALFRYGIGLEDVRAALSAANANSPKGALEQGDSRYQIYVNDTAKLASDYQPLIVAYRNNAAVRLQDVATVTTGVEDVRNLGLADGTTAILVVLHRQPGANVIDVVNRVRALIPELQASIPASIRIIQTNDRTETIRASLRDTERTLLIAIALVVLVVFLMLRDARAALVPSVAVPLSLIGTFGAMYLLHFSLDNLSLMALTVATGFVVDDAIVMLENIARHVEQGMPRIKAALLGAREVGFTVLAMSLSLVAVFLPILLMGGLVGRTFREFALTLSIAIAISLLVSLTTTPMMCAYVLRSRHRQGRFLDAMERGFDRMRDFYGRTLRTALDHPRTVMLLLAVTVGLNFYLFAIVPKGFFPQQDTGTLTGNLRADQSISFQAMVQKLRTAMAIVQRDPAVQDVVGFTGGGGYGATNTANIYVGLKPLAQRGGVKGDRIIAPSAHPAAADQRRPPVPAVHPGYPRRRAAEQFAVPVHAACRQPGGSAHLDTAHHQGAAGRAGAGRRQFRSAGQRLDSGAEARPRHFGASRHQSLQHRQHPLRRLRPAPGLDHLQRHEPVSRRHGGRSELLAEPRDAQGDLGQHLGRRPQRHTDHRRRRRLVQ